MTPDAFRKGLKSIKQEFESRIMRALASSGELVSGEAKRLVQRSPRGGIVYRRYDPNRIAKSSAPGEPAATDTGALASSITYEVVEAEHVVIIRSAAGLAPYARALEYGTADGSLKARPFMRPALKNMENHVRKLIDDAKTPI